jgi:hypothetical protein
VKPSFQRLLIAATLLATPAAHAHHGRDFLLLETARLPECGDLFGISRQDYVSADSTKVLLWQPSLLFGAVDWIAYEMHGHVEKGEGESFHYEATAPAAHVRFTPRTSPLVLGASVEYEFARHGAPDSLEAAAVLEYESGHWHHALNLLLDNEQGSGADPEWGYGAGSRYELTEEHSIGLELRGSLEPEGGAEAMAGYYFEASERVTFNVGLGTGFDDGPDATVRTALIWKLN